MKVTCLTNIYNEEYLLPFWLEHHKSIFDHGIIVNYASTDRSIEICRAICPEWTIIDSRNEWFDAVEIDREIMDLEHDIDGFKIVLNTTEFLMPAKPIKEILQEQYANCIEIGLKLLVYSPYSIVQYEPKNLHELFQNLSNSDVKFHNDRWVRFLHNNIDGKYHTGRHNTYISNIIEPNDIFVLWLGFYPLNEQLLKRKLQINVRRPQHNIASGAGAQHGMSREEMLARNHAQATSNNGFSVMTNLQFYKAWQLALESSTHII